MLGLEHMMPAMLGRDGAAGGGSSNLNWRLLPPELPTGSSAPHKSLIQREVTSVPLRGGRKTRAGAVRSSQGQGGGAAAQGALGNLGTQLVQPNR